MVTGQAAQQGFFLILANTPCGAPKPSLLRAACPLRGTVGPSAQQPWFLSLYSPSPHHSPHSSPRGHCQLATRGLCFLLDGNFLRAGTGLPVSQPPLPWPVVPPLWVDSQHPGSAGCVCPPPLAPLSCTPLSSHDLGGGVELQGRRTQPLCGGHPTWPSPPPPCARWPEARRWPAAERPSPGPQRSAPGAPPQPSYAAPHGCPHCPVAPCAAWPAPPGPPLAVPAAARPGRGTGSCRHQGRPR